MSVELNHHFSLHCRHDMEKVKGHRSWSHEGYTEDYIED